MNDGLTDLIQIVNTVKSSNPELMDTLLENLKSKNNTEKNG